MDFYVELSRNFNFNKDFSSVLDFTRIHFKMASLRRKCFSLCHSVLVRERWKFEVIVSPTGNTVNVKHKRKWAIKK